MLLFLERVSTVHWIFLPVPEVNARYVLAAEPWVVDGVGQPHHPELYGGNIISVLADDLGLRCFPDFLQLFC